MTEVQKNTKQNLIMTLTYFSSKEEQVRYKNAVPFVHIPIEIMEQWSSGFLPEQEWFREIFTTDELNVLSVFNIEVLVTQKALEVEDNPDVPDIFKINAWNGLMIKAQETIDKLNIGV